MQLYHVAAYLRLSREDGEAGGCRAESNSIQTQREMILSYIRTREDMELYDVYADDGWSGVDFRRPEFGRMMKDIEAGRVNCVIVKDLSRFGRDYIEAGRLIQRTFPAFSVRFIALTDDFDSLTADFNETALVLPVKNFVNDSYCRDISVKVRSHQRIKREKGEFIGAFCAYGYQKSRTDRHMLVPDAYAADIVKLIFGWKLEGYSCSGIAMRLKELGILSPMEHRRWRGEQFQTGFVTGIRPEWSGTAVKRILQNEVYIGNLVQGKAEKINYKLRESRAKPKEEWIRVEHTHQAVIDKEDFEIVQEFLRMDTRAGKGLKKAHRYAGILLCGDCRRPMIRRVIRCKECETVHFICSTHNRGEGCSRHDIREEKLDTLVMTGLCSCLPVGRKNRRMAAWPAENTGVSRWFGRYGEEASSQVEAVTDVFIPEIERLKRQWERYPLLRSALEEDRNNDVISEEEYEVFHDIYEKQFDGLREDVRRQEIMLPVLIQSAGEAEARLEHMKQKPGIWELNRMTLLTFVKQILIYEDRRVYLELRCGRGGPGNDRIIGAEGKSI